MNHWINKFATTLGAMALALVMMDQGYLGSVWAQGPGGTDPNAEWPKVKCNCYKNIVECPSQVDCNNFTYYCSDTVATNRCVSSRNKMTCGTEPDDHKCKEWTSSTACGNQISCDTGDPSDLSCTNEYSKKHYCRLLASSGEVIDDADPVEIE